MQGRNCDLTVDADEGFILREITSDKVEIQSFFFPRIVQLEAVVIPHFIV